MHTFICNYDLSDMPAGTKMFLRQKATLTSAKLRNEPGHGGEVQNVEVEETTVVAECDGCNNVEDRVGKMGTTSLCGNASKYEDTSDQNFCQAKCSEIPTKGSPGSFKVKHNSSCGALRYALHFRFLCPPPKKSSSKSLQRCKCNTLSPTNNGSGIEQDRRIYLYNDMRVVFPRHADSDEVDCGIPFSKGSQVFQDWRSIIV